MQLPPDRCANGLGGIQSLIVQMKYKRRAPSVGRFAPLQMRKVGLLRNRGLSLGWLSESRAPVCQARIKDEKQNLRQGNAGSKTTRKTISQCATFAGF